MRGFFQVAAIVFSSLALLFAVAFHFFPATHGDHVMAVLALLSAAMLAHVESTAWPE